MLSLIPPVAWLRLLIGMYRCQQELESQVSSVVYFCLLQFIVYLKLVSLSQTAFTKAVWSWNIFCLLQFDPLVPNVRKTGRYYATLECRMSRKLVTYNVVQNWATSEAQKRNAAFLISSLRYLMFCRCSFTKTKEVRRVLHVKLRGKTTPFYNSPA